MLYPIFGVQLGRFPIYQLMMLIGFIIGWILLGKALKKMSASPYITRRIRGSMFWGTLAGLLAANVANWFLIDGLMDFSLYYRLTHGGFTFYFGMLAFLVVSALLLRLRKLSVLTALNAVVPSLLMAHFLGRIGCSLRGCCWGISVGGHLFPARELEAVGLLALFIVFMAVPKIRDKRLPIYLFSYSAFRFILEFFRGDNRGTLFGVTALSPTQMVALIVVLISAVWLFLRPALRWIKKEEILDNIQAKRQARRAQNSNPYTPLPLDTPKQKRPLGVLHIVSLVLVFCLLLSSIAVTWNPFSMPIFESIKDSVNSLLMDARGSDTTIGDSNSTSIIPLSNADNVSDAAAAQTVINSLDTWADAQFTHTNTQTLASGNVMYVFEQMVLGKPVLGSERILVTDAAGTPLYAIGDAARLSFTDEISGSAVQSRSLTSTQKAIAKDIFADDVHIIDESVYLYDTGNGMREVSRVIVSEDGTTPLLGAIVDRTTKTILAYTDPEGKMALTANRTAIQLACAQMRHVMAYGTDRQMKQQSNRAVKSVGFKQQYERLIKALAKAYIKADLPDEDFLAILKSTESFVTNMTEINANVFCDVMLKETHSYLRNNGYSENKANRIIDKMEQAFERCGIKQTKDRAATEIAVRERKATHKFYMDFIGDSDVYTLTGYEEVGMTITFRPDSPITVEIYDTNGRSVLSTRIDSEQTITLYPEDGHSFTLRVSDGRNASDADDRSKYKIAVQSISADEQYPEYITNTLNNVAKAYNDSNLVRFFDMIADDAENTLAIEESVALGVMAPMMDSCYACVGLEDGVDTAKTTIAQMILLNYEDVWEEVQYLRGTTMDISCIRYIEQENATTLVKARVSLRMGDVYIYDGYSFLKLKNIDTTTRYETSEDPDLQRGRAALARLFSLFVGEKYHLIDANTDEILAAFGDTRVNIQVDNDLTSLYDLWETEELTDKYGLEIVIQSFDEEEAIEDGHSYEKVKSFADYTRRHNLMILRVERYDLQMKYEAACQTDDMVDIIFFGFGVVTDPVGTFLDLGAEALGLEDVMTVYKLFFDLDGLIMDQAKEQVKDDIAAESMKQSELYKKQLESVNGWIEEFGG